jgi:nitrite reductase/ring-hydroxylating ferredoxin subunit
MPDTSEANTPKHTWHRIATMYEVDHDLVLPELTVKTIVVEGKKICLGRYKNAYYAIGDKCMHAGGSLGEGKCDLNGNVICPFHRYKYNMVTGKNVSGEGYYAYTFPLETRADGIYIGFPVKKWWQIF